MTFSSISITKGKKKHLVLFFKKKIKPISFSLTVYIMCVIWLTMLGPLGGETLQLLNVDEFFQRSQGRRQPSCLGLADWDPSSASRGQTLAAVVSNPWKSKLQWMPPSRRIWGGSSPHIQRSVGKVPQRLLPSSNTWRSCKNWEGLHSRGSSRAGHHQ